MFDYQKGTRDGSGTNYLWFRIPLQIVFILWVYYFGLGINMILSRQR
jgi:hypothetical protein